MKKKANKLSKITRRGFIGAAASATAFTIVPRHVLAASGKTPPSDRLNIACIGVGGKGFSNVRSVKHENVVALCDVDQERAGDAFDLVPNAKRYSDFRVALEKEDKNIDAVLVTTPDHVHIPVTMMALNMGKHVYCEKPLGHNVHEVRMATELAKKTGLATQMGNTLHSASMYRRVIKLIQAGTIGDIKEAHVWVDNEWDPEPRVVSKNIRQGDDRPEGSPPVPEHLNWNLWLGPATGRPYHGAYHPQSWRGWWDFGNGRLGDMGCNILDLPFTALDLKHPLTIESEGPLRAGLERVPNWLISRWTFGQQGKQPPVELIWYDGNKRPEFIKDVSLPRSDVWPWYVAFVGTEGMLIAGEGATGEFKLYPEEKFAGVEVPEVHRIGHHAEWIEACKTGGQSRCNFDYAGPLTETVLLGTVAYRVGKKLEWDPVNMKATNAPEADQFLQRDVYRKGWEL